MDAYFLARHHGLPSRLLDWTTSALTALFFAVMYCPESDAAVVVLQPEQLGNWQDEGAGIPLSKRHPLVVATVKYLFCEGGQPQEAAVLPVFPELMAGRMEQQGGCFTLHMPGSNRLEQQKLTRLRIPQKSKRTIRRGLAVLGISWASLFPDLDHLVREIGESICG